jgi:hypothetical protein
MERAAAISLLLIWSAGVSCAQIPIPRFDVGIDAAGVFPISGFKAEEYSSGPALRVGGEFRLHRYLALDAGWTSAWLATNYDCSRFGCTYSRLGNQLLDYGVRGVLPLKGGRVELSAGVGGGYIWYNSASGDSYYYNGSLFQYSGKATVALNRNGRWRANLTVRTWRDVGRPVQVWLSTAAGISYGFGSVR